MEHARAAVKSAVSRGAFACVSARPRTGLGYKRFVTSGSSLCRTVRPRMRTDCGRRHASAQDHGAGHPVERCSDVGNHPTLSDVAAPHRRIPPRRCLEISSDPHLTWTARDSSPAFSPGFCRSPGRQWPRRRPADAPSRRSSSSPLASGRARRRPGQRARQRRRSRQVAGRERQGTQCRSCSRSGGSYSRAGGASFYTASDSRHSPRRSECSGRCWLGVRS